ncbi:MAG: hypothetical protein QOJ59_1295 [Thermomicrobiales bacterium]|nr:hypothetical protein [Thermomicrobiales bacterium]
MSRNVLRCQSCRAPLLHTRRNGRVKIAGGVVMETAEGLSLNCRCGVRREYRARRGTIPPVTARAA